MLFTEELCLIWSSIESFMAVTHLFVLLGFRNSKLSFLRAQKNYFLFDAFTHVVNLLLYFRSSNSISMKMLTIMWSIMLIVHVYYYFNLHLNPPLTYRQQIKLQDKVKDDSHRIARIFHWSCLEYQEDRFHLIRSGKPLLETIADTFAHTTGFYFAFQYVESYTYRLTVFLLMIAFLYRQMLNLPHFINDPKMMPAILRKLFSTVSNQMSTIDPKQS